MDISGNIIEVQIYAVKESCKMQAATLIHDILWVYKRFGQIPNQELEQDHFEQICGFSEQKQNLYEACCTDSRISELLQGDSDL